MNTVTVVNWTHKETTYNSGSKLTHDLFYTQVGLVLSAEFFLGIRKVRRNYKRGGGNNNGAVAIYIKMNLFLRKHVIPYLKEKWSKSNEHSKVKHKEQLECYKEVRETSIQASKLCLV
jgi:hypothetical protein